MNCVDIIASMYQSGEPANFNIRGNFKRELTSIFFDLAERNIGVLLDHIDEGIFDESFIHKSIDRAVRKNVLTKIIVQNPRDYCYQFAEKLDELYEMRNISIKTFKGMPTELNKVNLMVIDSSLLYVEPDKYKESVSGLIYMNHLLKECSIHNYINTLCKKNTEDLLKKECVE